MTVSSPWGCRLSLLPNCHLEHQGLLSPTLAVREGDGDHPGGEADLCIRSVVASFCTAAWVRMLMTTAGRCRSKCHQRDHARQKPRRVPDTAPDLAGRVCHLACAAASTQGLLRGLPKQCRQTKRRCRQGSPDGAIHAHEVGYQGKHCEGKDHSAHFSGGK